MSGGREILDRLVTQSLEWIETFKKIIKSPELFFTEYGNWTRSNLTSSFLCKSRLTTRLRLKVFNV